MECQTRTVLPFYSETQWRWCGISHLHESFEAEQEGCVEWTLRMEVAGQEFVVVTQIFPDVSQTRLLNGKTVGWMLMQHWCNIIMHSCMHHKHIAILIKPINNFFIFIFAEHWLLCHQFLMSVKTNRRSCDKHTLCWQEACQFSEPFLTSVPKRC